MYYTWISKKQIGVLFANYKKGNLAITDEIVSFLYNNCAERKGYKNDTNMEDVLVRVKEAIDFVFAGNYEEATKSVNGAFNLYNACFKN